MNAPAKLRVALVDDSALVRKHLTELLEKAGIEVSITAADPLFAWPKMQANWPDVVVLDVEMPRMDGLSFLRQIMNERPTPVVMCSTLTEAGCETTLQALAAGAVSFVTKPKLGLRDFLGGDSNGLVSAVRAAARANMGSLARAQNHATAPRTMAAAPMAGGLPSLGALAETTDRVIAIGSSTGGVQTLESLLTRLPRTAPGIVVVQHMPEKFTQALASRLDGLCAMEIAEARDGDRVVPGRVLIAPGGRHMKLLRSGAWYVVEVRDGPLVNHHKPSVDVLFRSVAQCAGRNAVGLILTGMGDDGARGLLEMRQAGARTLGQDEASCVVYGMPKAAAEIGAVEQVVPLNDIPNALLAAAARPLG
ncbi:chemotaxis response regulator protein-glutamate methylesterase [Roseateles sp. BYS180W]|uniref:Protein-glutamate methylesterase/protein-glutamine glutaminase n=1 Tax=Roseateles rivi TaxID=3299028 RepID=A0ABW7FU75_9BURK